MHVSLIMVRLIIVLEKWKIVLEKSLNFFEDVLYEPCYMSGHVIRDLLHKFFGNDKNEAL